MLPNPQVPVNIGVVVGNWTSQEVLLALELVWNATVFACITQDVFFDALTVGTLFVASNPMVIEKSAAGDEQLVNGSALGVGLRAHVESARTRLNAVDKPSETSRTPLILYPLPELSFSISFSKRRSPCRLLKFG